MREQQGPGRKLEKRVVSVEENPKEKLLMRRTGEALPRHRDETWRSVYRRDG